MYLVVVTERQGVLDGQPATDVERGQGRAYSPQVAINLKRLGQLVPIVGCIPDPGVHEEVKHPEVHERMVLQTLPVKGNDVLIAHAQPRGVELKLGLFLRCNSQSHVHRGANHGVQTGKLLLVVEDGKDASEALFPHGRDPFDVGRRLEAIANHRGLPVHVTGSLKSCDDVQVERRTGLDQRSMPEDFLRDVAKVRTLGHVAIMVVARVIQLRHG